VVDVPAVVCVMAKACDLPLGRDHDSSHDSGVTSVRPWNDAPLTAFAQVSDSASPGPNEIKGINGVAAGKGVVGMASAVVAPAWLRLRHPLLLQVARYVMVGGLGTAVSAAAFLLLRFAGLEAVPANLVALLVSTAVSTEANRRFTFGGGAVHRWRAHVQIGGTVLFYAFYSSAVLLLLGLVVDAPTPVGEAVTLAAASVLGGVCRFLVLRYWVFGTREAPTRPAAPEPGTVDAWDERA
jgi:putative flippase GtrA